MRIEARQADEAPVHQRHREQRTYAHRVVQRHDAERALATAVLVLRHVRKCGRALMAMPVGNALGLAGGARGVEHERDVLRVRRAFISDGPDIAGAGAKGIPMRRGGSFADRAGTDARKAARGAAVPHRGLAHWLEEHGLGLRIGDAIVDLLGLGAPVQRNDHDAAELAGPVQGCGLMTVLHHRQHPFVPLEIGQPHRAIDERHGVRAALHALEEGRSEVQHVISLQRGIARLRGARRFP